VSGAIHYRRQAVDDLEIFYREAGPSKSPTLVLFHGFPTSSHMFRDLMPLLADRFHLIAPDYPGFGYSSAPDLNSFSYTFDHVADVMDRFLEAIDVDRYALYMQDFGGPIGLRIAKRHPERVQGLIVQNANAYEEGITQVLRDVVLPSYKKRTPEGDAALRTFFERATTMQQFLDGVPDPSLVSPDSYEHAQWGMDRPGNKAIQLEMHANYGSNIERYEEWHTYFRDHQPPALVAWGRGDRVFASEGAAAYGKDLKSAEIHLLDAGHFALETHAQTIAELIREFCSRVMK
jgi:pimeloyl-ACP methyl ester carboxylesterase